MSINTVFNISDTQLIKIINLCLAGNHFYRYDKAKVIFISNEDEYLLYDNDLIAALDSFKFILEKAIGNEWALAKSIKKDIGILWNDYLQKKNIDAFEMQNIEERKSWIGINYLILSSIFFDTWLYNKAGSIFIEITPIYPWHFKDPEPHEIFIEYEEWVKDYKPLLISEINKESATEWLVKLNHLFKALDIADKKFLYKN